MKISKSELKLLNLFIDNCSFDFIQLEEELPDDTVISDCDLDFEYEIKQNNDQTYMVFLTITGNKSKDIAGYTFEVTGVGFFEIESELDKKNTQSLLNSALAMVIAHLRAFIMNITNNMVFGRYNLPAIDLTKLVNDKIAASNQEKIDAESNTPHPEAK